MQQLQLIDQSSQLLDDLVNTVLSPTLSRSAKLAEIGRILAHFDLPIEAPRVAGQLWSATELGKELGVSAQAIGRLADVTIVDRDTGATLPVHYARGEYWVAGRPGARYAITVRNRLGERVLVWLPRNP